MHSDWIARSLEEGNIFARRKRGIGAKLVQWVIQHAQETCCRAIYLHVIDYNHAAMALYRREHFQQVACRDNFYHIT